MPIRVPHQSQLVAPHQVEHRPEVGGALAIPHQLMDFLGQAKIAYTGDLVNNEPHGVGEMTMEDGKVYKGGFKNG